MIRWGILGTGVIADKFATGFAAVQNAHLSAVGSRTAATAENFAQKHGIPHVYDSYEALLADDKADVIYIATPHTQHYENMLQCLRYGKHVLCEKPFTVNSCQAEEIFRVAKEKKLFVMEAMWSRFIPGLQQVLQMVGNGVIGEVQMVKADFGFLAPTDPLGRHHNKALAGGALLDVGIYPLNLAFWILGSKPEEIVSLSQIGPTGVDEQNTILLRYASGAMAQLASSIRTKLSNSAVIIGDKGKIMLDRFWCVESIVWEIYNGSVYSHHVPVLCNGYEYEIIEVNRCVAGGLLGSERHSWKFTTEVLKIMDDIRAHWGLRYPCE